MKRGYFKLVSGTSDRCSKLKMKRSSPMPDVRLAFGIRNENLEAKIKSIEGKMTELLPRPIALVLKTISQNPLKDLLPPGC
ncbi:hypothetical protein TNCV_4091151 [Trichonephila clavipes]|uniref:Uncharacterized protein n=1 Tax=Trichonephila clavipes TaxID=2585209 RepID=A0A8X6RIB4_TRICX|nr:hypothetical protein TNCV_4091151 [Trichonephila clavipes]